MIPTFRAAVPAICAQDHFNGRVLPMAPLIHAGTARCLSRGANRGQFQRRELVAVPALRRTHQSPKRLADRDPQSNRGAARAGVDLDLALDPASPLLNAAQTVAVVIAGV